MNLKERENRIKNVFKNLTSWEDKYEYLIDLGNSLKKKSSEFRSNDKLIQGCQSNVWLEATLKNNRLFFEADSEAILPKGMISLMIRLYSGLNPLEIIYADSNIISEIGLDTFLTPIRANGIILFFKKIKFYAFAFNYKINLLQEKTKM
ncbi:SufE family protein [Blattabacterium cuenoti]|nr:SufE family protein [Blattabacterium cuenoti]